MGQAPRAARSPGCLAMAGCCAVGAALGITVNKALYLLRPLSLYSHTTRRLCKVKNHQANMPMLLLFLSVYGLVLFHHLPESPPSCLTACGKMLLSPPVILRLLSSNPPPPRMVYFGPSLDRPLGFGLLGFVRLLGRHQANRVLGFYRSRVLAFQHSKFLLRSNAPGVVCRECDDVKLRSRSRSRPRSRPRSGFRSGSRRGLLHFRHG